MADDDGMTPEELKRLYFGPSAGQGPEGTWQPPRVPPPPAPEPEPPAWVDSHHKEETERAARDARILRELEIRNARTASDQKAANDAEWQRQYEQGQRRREREAEADQLRRDRESEARERRDHERSLEDSRQHHERQLESDRRHEDLMRDLTSPDVRTQQAAVRRMPRPPQPITPGLQDLAPRPALGAYTPNTREPFPNRAESFVIGLFVGAAGAALGFAIRDWLRLRYPNR